MHRILPTLILATGMIASACVSTVWAGVDVDVNISVPPPPAIVLPAPPRAVVIPRTHVYYVPEATDYDMYRLGPYWYVNRGGYWYRSREYGGPFAVVEFRHVPHALVALPVGYRHHPLHPHFGPPGKDFKKHWKGHKRDKHWDY